jgi:putative endonuclease
MFYWLRKMFQREPESFGAFGERLAEKAARRAGYEILYRNARIGRYEVDLIAREGDTIAFIEVKTRRAENMVLAEANVNAKKREHLRKAARMFIAKVNNPSAYFRFDVITVICPEQGEPAVTIIRDAFSGRE